MTYKVSYFNFMGIGETIRFLLSYGDIEFEDNRIDMEQWPSIKPQMPFGRMPILEYNGKVAHQSTAICRYFAKKVKLIGKDEWEDLEIDAAADTINELRSHIVKYHYEANEKVKESRLKPLVEETMPYYVGKLEEQVKSNGGYLAAGKLTWADLFFVAQLDFINFMLKKDLLADAPNLQALKDKVLALPNIKKWIEKRPKTEM